MKKKVVKDTKNPDLIKLGNRIKSLRIKKGYTSFENFAYDHGFHRAQFGRYENGDDDIRYSTLQKISKAFGMSLKEFFSEGFD